MSDAAFWKPRRWAKRSQGIPPRSAAIWPVLAALMVMMVLTSAESDGTSNPKYSERPVLTSRDSGAGPPPPIRPTPIARLNQLFLRLSSVSLSPEPLGTLPSTPTWLAYDPADQSFYVAVDPSDVDIVPANFTSAPVVTATIPVGSAPFGVTYDNLSGDLFVTNSGSNNVSVLSGSLSSPISSISVGWQPQGVAYDPVNNEVYVANNGSDNVSVISAASLQVVATVSVGVNPLGVAADPSTGNVYVANWGSSNVTVISGSTNQVLRNDPTPAGPYGVAVDNLTDTIYVSDEGARNVSVISGSTLAGVTNISVTQPGYLGPVDLQGIAYDSGDGLIWVGGGRATMAVIEPANETLLTVLNFDPSGVAYDPETGDICVTNTANTTFECARFFGGVPQSLYPADFNQTGLPEGAAWSVAVTGVGSGTGLAGGTPIQFDLVNGSYFYTAAPPYSWVASPSNGTLTISGTGVTVNMTFAHQSEYAGTFTETGLAQGTPWTVEVSGGAGSFSSSSTNLTAWLTNGSYTFTVGMAIGYTAEPSEGSITVNGANLTQRVAFSPIPVPGDYLLTFQETGLPNGTGWGVAIGSELQTSSSNQLIFTKPNGTFDYVVLAVTGYTATSSGSVTVDGTDVTVAVEFQPESYPVIFVELGLPSGSRWSVTATNSTTEFNRTASSVTDAVTIPLPNGTYAISFSLPPGYSVKSSVNIVTVEGSAPNTYALTAEGSPGPSNSSSGALSFVLLMTLVVGSAFAALALAVVGRGRAPPH